MTDQGIFTSEAALLPDFVPEEPLHRESQLKDMASSLKPAIESLQPDNLFIYGATGTGKTTCAKHVAKELNEYKTKVNCVYINCWENNTRLSILNEIGKSIEIGFPRRGLAGDEVLARIVEFSKKGNFTSIVFLDEFDQLIARKEENVAYELTRAGENHGVDFGVVIISNNSNLLDSLDNRIKSSLSPRKIEFPRYSPIELKDILRERAKLSLRPDSWSEEVIALCAAHAAKTGGDCRVSLRTLWRAARIAESEAADEIKEKHVRKAFENSEETQQVQSEVEKKILNILSRKENQNGITSGELYEALKNVATERSLRMHVDALIQRNAIDAVEVKGKEMGGRGRSRLVKLRQ